MQLLKREFDNFDGANYLVAGLSKAIDTTYIPSGGSIEEVYASFLKIQLGRSFNHNCGFGSANLEMVFNESAMTFHYSSTSGTEVFLQYCFNEQMEFKGGSVECWLPDERVGGQHYELITEFIYDHEWSKDGEVVVPQELISLNPKGTEFPTPVWVLDDLANRRAEKNPAERDAQLLEFGYTPVAKPIGFKRVWESSNPEAYYPYIVLSEQSHNSKNYFILSEDSCVERDYSVSYKTLLEILAEPPKESRRSRKARAAKEVENYDYDESEWVYVMADVVDDKD
jgi:hypothetical protein